MTNITDPRLSKTRFTAGLQCLKLLYLDWFSKDLADPVDPSQQALFDSGTEVGVLARQRFPGGLLIEAPYDAHSRAVTSTSKALEDTVIPAFYEAAFTFEGIRVRVDILSRNGDGTFDLIEVKSSTSVKQEHIPDAAIQLHVLENSGVPVRNVFLQHIDNTYVYEGGPYDLEFPLPDDFNAEELAGKQASYTVTINEVKQEILPDLDDEFVKSLDEQDLETVEQLRARIAEEVNTRAEAEAKASYHDEIVDLLVARAEIDYPEIIVEHEIDRQIDQQSNHASHTQEGLDAWLGAIGKTEEEIRNDLRESADQAVRRALVLGELTEAEEIVIGDEQVDAEIERMASQLGTPGESSE